MNTQIEAREYKTAREAIRAAERTRGASAIRIGRCYWVVGKERVRELEADGLPFAHLGFAFAPDGSQRIVTIPVN